MIEGAEEAADRVLAMVQAGAVITASGKHLPTPIRSICVHGDSAHAVATARLVRAAIGAGRGYAETVQASCCMTARADPALALSEPRFLDAGEAALVVQFGETVDPAINDRVLALDAALRADPPAGTREFVPTYRSLMIHYDPLQIDRDTLVAIVRKMMATVAEWRGDGTTWTLPCCYDPALAEDLDEAAKLLRLARDEVAALHAKATYRVYMCGFTPGQTYLGGVPERAQDLAPSDATAAASGRRGADRRRTLHHRTLRDADRLVCHRPDARAPLCSRAQGRLSDSGRRSSCGSSRSIWRPFGIWRQRAAGGEVVARKQAA